MNYCELLYAATETNQLVRASGNSISTYAQGSRLQ